MEKKHKILIVDDVSDYREMFSLILQEKGYLPYSASCIQEAVSIIKSEKIEIVVTDLIMKNETGIDLLKWIKEYNSSIGVILVTAYGTVETAVDAMKIGAYNYFIKSSNPESLLFDIEKFLGQHNSQEEVDIGIENGKVSALLSSDNAKFNKLLRTCDKIAKTDISVLLLGESGVGKEVIARYIHTKSNRRASDFLAVNCQEYSEGILESELFGHEKGAFTGAFNKKIGKFEGANTGTLFLDEIADVSMNTQVKLLRVIENKRIERVGGNRKINIDIRLISATNKDIGSLVTQGSFREDFLYRINGIILQIPPLRERPEDIENFIRYFIQKSEKAFNKNIVHIDEYTMAFLKGYHYPGNIRELKTIIERLVVLAENGKIEYETAKYYLPHHKAISYHNNYMDSSFNDGSLRQARAQFEIEYIREKLIENNWNINKTAESLNISKRQLNNKISEYELRKSDKIIL